MDVVVEPSRRAPSSNEADQTSAATKPTHALDTVSIVESFSELGIICGVVGPKDSVMKAMRQADIVVLDWLLRGGAPLYTRQLLRDLLTGEVERNSLRLVAIYTGEAGLEEICTAVTEELTSAELHPEKSELGTEVSYQHGRIVIYAKSGVNLVSELAHRRIEEHDLPNKLVNDFASMTCGLLPSIALASLTAVREGEHMVLDRFGADLDAVFLSHRACLPNPEDAEGQIVSQIAEELRGLMDNAVAEKSPASAAAVESWIRRRGGKSPSFVFGDRQLDLQQTIKLANEGLEASSLKNNAFRDLTAGFAGDKVGKPDEKLAWIMSFRTVYNKPTPVLWLESVITELSDGDEQHLICMRPRCDCVRLENETSFFFLPLVGPREKTRMAEQIIIRLGDTFKPMGIQSDSSGWVLRQFKPLKKNGPVTSTKTDSGGGFEFEDTKGTRYRWLGELKAEYAQRIAQNFSATLARVAVDESEWLRRSARK